MFNNLEGGSEWAMKKRHPASVREWAIRQIMSPAGRSMTEVACELGVTTETLRLWKKAFLLQVSGSDKTKQCPALPMQARQAPAAEALAGGGKRKQIRYTAAFREQVVAQMMPPSNQTIVALAGQTGVTVTTLRAWQDAAREQGKIMARSSKPAQRWSSSDKFRMVLEAATLSEEDLSAYCRRQGVYPEQIAQWRQACELANSTMADAARLPPAAIKAQAKRLKQVERELVEARGLLVLRKKAEAIWGKDAEE
jgi:transposase-like protein